MQTTRCKACEAEIIFVTNVGTGRAMPVDAKAESMVLLDPVEAGEEPRGRVVQVRKSHFATCTNPEFFRRPR